MLHFELRRLIVVVVAIALGVGLVRAGVAAAYCRAPEYTGPTARATVSSTSVPYGTSLTFDASHSTEGYTTYWYIDGETRKCELDVSKSDPITSFAWDFGDETRAGVVAVSHTFTRPGTYHVKLTVTTEKSGDEASMEIAVTGPAASFQSPSTTEWTKGFDAGASTGPFAIADYQWDFGDGASAHGRSVTHTYHRAGSLPVSLTVTDVHGMSAATSKTVEVVADRVVPAIRITRPAPDDVYTVGQAVVASFVCSDVGGSGFGTDGCVGRVDSGKPIDTDTPGDKTFEVDSRSIAGMTNRAEVRYHVVSQATSVEIASPRDGGVYARGPALRSNYECHQIWEPATCTGSAEDGLEIANGAPIDMSRLGRHTFKVVARNGHGDQAEKSVTYDVVDATAPSVSIDAPKGAAVLNRDQVVHASFTCADDAGGSGLASCVGQRPLGAAIDTATPGAKTFTVHSKDRAGNESVGTVRYYVLDYPTLSSTVTMTYLFAKRGGVKITGLVARRVPAGARVLVRCRGKGCRESDKSTLVTTKRRNVVLRGWVGRTLSAGTVLKVAITKPSTIGLESIYSIRPRQKVVKTELCLPPGRLPTAC